MNKQESLKPKIPFQSQSRYLPRVPPFPNPWIPHIPTISIPVPRSSKTSIIRDDP